jgi:dihydrofolate reductase
MRRIIAALVVSVDGFIEGPNEELDWVKTWEDPFDLLPQIDTCILGRGTYQQYEQYWGSILANPNGIMPVTWQDCLQGRDRVHVLRTHNSSFRRLQDVGSDATLGYWFA